MVVEALDPVLISKLTSHQVEQVTCIECCKYFIAPETAACGHTLCHTCWKGRRVCHTCAAPIDRKSLRVNIPLQRLTEHIHVLADSFEKIFNVKLAEFTWDELQNLQTQDPSKHVKEWLANSDNHFSGPVISQTSDPELPKQMELSKSKIQIHSANNKSKSPVKVVKPLPPQEDWDKIEVLPDTEEENVKPEENVIGPMDFEPFFLDENEYSNDNPRRSLRNRELQGNSNPPTCDVSGEKNSTKNSNIDSKSLKNKQTWNSVKKMRKEFGKLNKKNKNKLNISIEMCKKAQAANKSKQAQTLLLQTDSEQTNLIIDDQTPHVSNKEHLNTLKDHKSDEGKQIHVSNNNIDMDAEEELPEAFVDKNPSENNSQSKCRVNESLNKNNKVEAAVLDNNEENTVKNTAFPDTNSKSDKSNLQSNVSRTLNMPFFKKGALRQNSNCINTSAEDDHVKIIQEEVKSGTATANTDDIEISIKIGNTVTNIVIKNKRNDVQMKVNTDREIQTSLGPYNLLNKQDAGCSPLRDVGVQDIELNIDENNKVEVNKTVSTKKNTASADTAPVTTVAQFEITDSMERELSDVMEHLERKRNRTGFTQKKPSSEKAVASPGHSQVVTVEKEISNIPKKLDNKNDSREVKPHTPSSDKKQALSDKESEKLENINEIPEDMADLNDIDIFNSGSVKEVNVQLLKDTKVAHSEILMPTIKSKISQKVVDKREREKGDDIEELPCSKKQRIDLDSIINEDKKETVNPVAIETQAKDLAIDSEQMNYDVIMSQVFANIDADMNKSSNKTEKTLVLKETTSNSQNFLKDNNIQISQIVHRTQKRPTQKDDSVIEIRNDSDAKDDVNQKFSENVFSMLEKDSETHNVSGKSDNKLLARVSTQQHIANLLTPGACDDLAHTHADSHTHTQLDKNADIVEPLQGTPVGENDDESVVEETPQKAVSFSKSKQSNDGPKTVTDAQKRLENSTVEKKRMEQKDIELEMIRSIINISDSTTEPSKINTTLVQVPSNKLSLSTRMSAETPLNINKFVNQIKHNSTPVARKSLNFDSENLDDPEQTLCPTTTQEKAVIAEAFRQSQTSPVKRVVALKSVPHRPVKKYFIAGSCLNAAENKSLKILCHEQGWTYLDKYTDDLTHLVVGVDDEYKSQRSVKYMCALAASKWIVSYDWVEKCLQTKSVVNELPFEVLDACGEPGPMRSRTAARKVFEGITFYCIPPFSVLNIDILKLMLESAGGKVVNSLQAAQVTADNCAAPALVLAEPEITQEDRFVFLAMKHQIVPLNYEWALNCLGAYSLCSIHELLLCPASVLPPAVNQWPALLRESLLADEDYAYV